MSIMLHLSSLALRGAAAAAGDVVGIAGAGMVADKVAGFLLERFVDQSQRLNRALARSTDRAWRAVELALAGNSWWDRCKLVVSSADERGFREQIQTFLKANPLDGVDGHGPNFRAQCLAQMQSARKAGLLKPTSPPPDRLARHVGSLSRFGDPTSRLKAEHKVVAMIADELRKHGYDALATFLELRPASGPPVLAAAVHYFFQREVEEDRELFQGLAYAQLESLAQGQSAGFASLAEALDRHGERLEELLTDVHAAVVQTRADVLDVKAELQRQGQQMQELGDAVLKALHQHQLEKRSLHAGDSLSLRDEDERRLVKDLVRRYRSLPTEERKRLPALLNAVGKLEVVAGEFESAERDFRELAGMVTESSARGEAAHNTYLAALERRAWADALSELKEAARMDASRFAPFPLEKFEPERILGAGGFGVAFLCRNTRSGGRVVIKTLRSEGMERDVKEVFREAQTLEALEHPAIIRIRDCDFADAERSRPYLVMDYFQGQTLAEYVEKNGPLKVNALLPLAQIAAEGLQRAHERGILHRDIKPANLLVRSTQKGWEVRLIDFGLAMRAPAKGSTRRSSLDRTLAGASFAGTLEYAAPEQIGKLAGVAVGPHSDVYGFAKTCCFALFGTASPTFQHWQQLPPALADLLSRCLAEQPSERLANFAAFLRILDKMASAGAEPRPASWQVEEPPPRRAEPATSPLRPSEPRERVDDRPAPLPSRRVHRPSRKQRVNPLYIILPALGAGLGLVCFLFMFLTSRPGTRSPIQAIQGTDSFPVTWNGSATPNLSLPVEKPPLIFFSSNPYYARFEIKPVRGFGINASYQPISLVELPGLLSELKGNPSLARRTEIASRLAATDRSVSATEATPVSRALNPLLDETNFRHKMVGAQALIRWGTSENVDKLLTYLDGQEGGVFDFRITVAFALAKIGEERSLGRVVKLLEHSWDSVQPGIVDAISAYGSRAEDHVRWYLRVPRRNVQQWLVVIAILNRIGTSRSLDDLTVLASQKGTIGVDAKKAIQAINDRAKR